MTTVIMTIDTAGVSASANHASAGQPDLYQPAGQYLAMSCTSLPPKEHGGKIKLNELRKQKLKGNILAVRKACKTVLTSSQPLQKELLLVSDSHEMGA